MGVVSAAWKMFRKYLLILTGKGFSLKLKVNYTPVVLGTVQYIHGSKSWPMKVY